MMPKPAGVAAWAMLAASLGCGGASIAPPNDAWAAAQADIGRAQASGAPDVPNAKLHLQLAQESLQRARQLMGTDNERASSLCGVATSEAQLAFALARQAKAEDEARSAQAEMQKQGGAR
jgi:hypothetical protein